MKTHNLNLHSLLKYLITILHQSSSLPLDTSTVIIVTPLNSTHLNSIHFFVLPKLTPFVAVTIFQLQNLLNSLDQRLKPNLTYLLLWKKICILFVSQPIFSFHLLNHTSTYTTPLLKVLISVEIITHLNLLQIQFTNTVDLTLAMSPTSENVELPIQCLPKNAHNN